MDNSSYLAKTYIMNGHKVKGRSVFSHCSITGEIAKELLNGMLPVFKCFFPEFMPFLASIHDIGKVSPTFQEKIYRSLEDYKYNSGEGLKNVNPESEKNWGGHAGTGFSTMEYIIKQRQNRKDLKYIPYIVGAHHGGIPEKLHKANDEVLGGEEWNNKRIKLFEDLRKFFNADIPVIKDDLSARIAAGLMIVSDWIASGNIFDNPYEKWESKINVAVENAGFRPLIVKKNLSFYKVFGFKPRKPQKQLIDICTEPGIYILEAPMGMGKTEAALYCAYKMIENNMARGIYFALPTQITSNKIYDRIIPFIRKISVNEEQIKLLHTNAMIHEMGNEAAPGKSWFNSAKRGLLAPFAVGTIDQALMSVMNVRHSSVRAFGLFGKVVILDEVHTYDSYTGTILDKLVKDLANMGCTVIILSATLTKERIEKITGYKGAAKDYPLITSIKKNEQREYTAGRQKNKRIIIQHLEDLSAAEEAIKAAQEGQQVLWIENTVDEAQEAYKTLNVIGGFECGLLHSRFLKYDRNEFESKWIDLYSHKNKERYSSGRILIGTQVVEQSLDIDADLLITRLAPVDFLLQRMGRLWRHTETIRHKNAEPRCIIMPIPDMGKKSGLVYSPYVLERTKEVLLGKNYINIPKQIRELIEETYSERFEETEIMNKYKNDLIYKKEKMKNYALQTFAKSGLPLPDETPSTRYSDMDTISLLLVKELTENKIRFTDDKILNIPEFEGNYKEKREIAAELNKNIITVPLYKAPEKNRLNLKKLSAYIYIDDNFRIAILEKNNLIKTIDRRESNDKYNLYYYKHLGYMAIKKEGNDSEQI